MSELPPEYKTDPGFDPAEDHIGPFSYSTNRQGQYAFMAESRHCNAHGTVHGGVLMTFADYALCMAATDHYKNESCVTVSFSSEFVAAAHVGDFIEATTSVTRKTRSMAFVTGTVQTHAGIAMTFSSVVKRIVDKED